MNDLKAVARLVAAERGEAVAITRERPFPISTWPMILMPIQMAGESPSLFALGVGTLDGHFEIEVCCEPRDREEQYRMLERAAAHMAPINAEWEDDPTVLPQIVTPSAAATKLVLAVIDRMAFAPEERAEIKRIGRALYIADRSFERPDSSLLLDVPAALNQLFATGQDDHADQHLGALLEWYRPSDGEIYRRVMGAEQETVSTATAPELDNGELDPLLARLRRARKDGDTVAETQIQSEIREIFIGEVERRHGLVMRGLGIVTSLPPSEASRIIHDADRRRFDQHRVYVSDPRNHLTRGLRDDFAAAEFLGREMAADLVETLRSRTVSGARCAARLAGDIVIGQVRARREGRRGRSRLVEYDIWSEQDRLGIRPRDDLVLINGHEEFGFRIRSYEADGGGTLIHAEMTAGKTKPGHPQVGDAVELAKQVMSDFAVSRAMRIAWSRLRARRPRPHVTGPVGQNQDLLAVIRARRRQD